MTVLAVVLALLAAMLFAVASAAQQRTAAAVPDAKAHGLGLMKILVRRPLWWVGTVSDGTGYAAQAAALGLGSLLLVQPLLVTTLLFALPLSARWAGRHLRRTDWMWAGLLAAALAVFVVSGDPTAGVDRAPVQRWLPAAAVLGALLAGCLLGAATRRGTSRAVLLAVATGVAFGVVAALTKGAVSRLDDGIPALLTTWEAYGVVGASIAGTLMQQSAYQAGALSASLPAMTVGEPVVAVALGVAVLEEQLRSDGAEWVLIGALVVVMVAATVALARSAAQASDRLRVAGVPG